jgi:predicted RNA-binding protein with PIN domain
MTYYIDAYNVIHCSSPLKTLAQKSMDAARQSLIRSVSEYCTVTNEEMVLVFDGAGDPAALAGYRGRTAGKLRIEFCENEMSADTYIGRALYGLRNTLNAVVVTADGAVAESARGMGALVIAPQSFVDQVESTLSESRTKRKVPGKDGFGVALSDRLSVEVQEGLRAMRSTAASKRGHRGGKRRPKKERAGPGTGS